MNWKELLGMLLLWAAIFGLGFTSCRRQRSAAADEDDNMVGEARLLRLFRMQGYWLAEIVNPWDTTSTLARYALVERGTHPMLPDEKDLVRIEVPLQRSVLYSSVHGALVDELGHSVQVAGVADGKYFKSPYREAIRRDDVVDVGSSRNPSLEELISVGPDAILVEPYENAGHGVLDRLGIPVIECADYMESTPKGRAEWMKFFGLLYGCVDEASALYDKVAARYDSISLLAAKAKERPSVLMELPYQGVWFVPGGGSYSARLVTDAGGRWPWSDNHTAGSLQLDAAAVYAGAADADVWLIKSYGHTLSREQVGAMDLAKEFKAWREGNVYVADTEQVPFFEDLPFHPDRVLEEYVKIFHPGLIPGNLRYFSRAE